MSAVPGSFFASHRKFQPAPARNAPPLTSTGHPGGQIPMRQPQFIRSNTFHWAFMVAGVFAIFVIVLFGFIYWEIDVYLVERSDRMITSQITAIAAIPPGRRLDAIEDDLRQDSRG